MINDTKYKNIWNDCVIGLSWNKPPNNPRPIAKKDICLMFYNANDEEYNRITIVSLLYSIDLSRLDVTALDSIIKIKENIVIVFLGVEPIFKYYFLILPVYFISLGFLFNNDIYKSFSAYSVYVYVYTSIYLYVFICVYLHVYSHVICLCVHAFACIQTRREIWILILNAWN